MSTAGSYNVHVNILNPGKYLNNQMASQQKPFYFGGSQVPINLNPSLHQSSQSSGSGFKPTTHSLYRERKNIYPTSGLCK
jgi:hypothetical protein